MAGWRGGGVILAEEEMAWAQGQLGLWEQLNSNTLSTMEKKYWGTQNAASAGN